MLLPFFSCSHGSGDDAEQSDILQSPDTDDEAKDDGDDEGDDNGLPHPAKATAFQTRVLVKTTPQPSAERVAGCIEQVEHIAGDATNQQAMLNAQSQVTALAAQDVALYHFCFYQMMVSLDEKLDGGGPMMTDEATTFFEGMRKLWLLARGLDQLSGRQTYFQYLQARYIQISRDDFGRDVGVIGPPMGDVPSSFGTAPAH